LVDTIPWGGSGDFKLC